MPDSSPPLFWLGRARVLFAAVFLLRTTPLLLAFDPLFLRGMGPLWGWPDDAFRAPVLGIDLPNALIAALCILRTAGAVALLLGVRARAGGLLAGIAGYLVLAQDAFSYYHHLHLLFLGAILFGLTDAGARFALVPDRPRAPATSIALMRWFVASIYLWAAVGKLRPDWLDGRALVLFHSGGALDGALIEWLIADSVRAAAAACAVAGGEIAIGLGLMWPRTRPRAVAAALLLHLLFEIHGRVDTIGWQMVALLLVFMPLGFTDRSRTSAATG